jgi:nucleoside-diphosphate-sugar epimerase
MTDLYRYVLELPSERIDGGVYNAGYENHKVKDIARMVKEVVGPHVEIETTPSDDQRSYHVSSEKIRKELDFVPQHGIKEAVQDLVDAFDSGKIPDPMESDVYYNVKRMKRLLEEA